MAARGDGVRHAVRRTARHSRRQDRKSHRRQADEPGGGPQRRCALVGRAADDRQSLGRRRSKSVVAGPRRPAPRHRRGVRTGPVKGAPPVDVRHSHARHARRPAADTPEGGRRGQRRERVGGGEPEDGEERHGRKITRRCPRACDAPRRCRGARRRPLRAVCPPGTPSTPGVARVVTVAAAPSPPGSPAVPSPPHSSRVIWLAAHSATRSVQGRRRKVARSISRA
jgi:hypothetical protein